jgi:hypothetical protein
MPMADYFQNIWSQNAYEDGRAIASPTGGALLK